MISRTSPHYQVEGSGPLLIHVAGLDGTGQLFFKQAPRLGRAHRVVTFRSREQGRFTYEDLTDDLAAIIRDQVEQRATIVGESFGGTVALSFALRYPLMVERLVVVNSFSRFRKRLTIKLGVKLASGVPYRMLWPVRRAASTLGLLVDGVGRDDRRLFEMLILEGAQAGLSWETILNKRRAYRAAFDRFDATNRGPRPRASPL